MEFSFQLWCKKRRFSKVNSSEQYKRQIMNDLSQVMLKAWTMLRWTPEYENFDDFAQRSSHEERRQLFGRFTSRPHPQPNGARTPKAIAQIKPNERDDVVAPFKHLKHRGLSDRDLERQLVFLPITPITWLLMMWNWHLYLSQPPDIFQEGWATGYYEVSQ